MSVFGGLRVNIISSSCVKPHYENISVQLIPEVKTSHLAARQHFRISIYSLEDKKNARHSHMQTHATATYTQVHK